MNQADLAIVPTLLRDSFESSLWPYMTYAQQGTANYLGIPFRYPNIPSDKCQLVATIGHDTDRPIAFADFRNHPDGSAFLSYVCVSREARGRGVASALLNHFLRTQNGVRSLGLDTFEDNTVARSLYQRFGFTEEKAFSWVTRQLPSPGTSVVLTSLPPALATYERYGFCELTIADGADGLKYGLIGESTVRCFTAESFENDENLGGISQLFPATVEAFAVLADEAAKDLTVSHNVVKRSMRMTLAID